MGQSEFVAFCHRTGLHDNDWDVAPDGGSGLDLTGFDIDPHDFLAQAEMDLNGSSVGGDQNALTNAKRSVTCVIDQILSTFGYSPLRWNMKRKMSTVAAMGVVTPRILEKINRSRNMLEHSYQAVTHAEAEDAVDIATLFVASASQILRMFPGDFYVARGGDDHHYEQTIHFSYGLHTPRMFTVWERTEQAGDWVELGLDDPSFLPIVALALAADRGLSVDREVANLNASILASSIRPSGSPEL